MEEARATAAAVGGLLLVPGEDAPTLELRPAVVATLGDAKQTRALIQRLVDVAPLAGHLKRVRRSDDGDGMDVLLAAGAPRRRRTDSAAAPAPGLTAPPPPPAPPSPPLSPSTLPPPLAAVVAEFGLTAPRSAGVPRWPPPDAAAARAWSETAWPVVARPRDVARATGPPASPPDDAHVWLARAAALAAGAGGGGDAAVVVDPAAGAIVGEAASGPRRAHPLHHAAMLAISAVAERDVREWPEEGGGEGGGNGDAAAPPPSASARPYLATGYDAYLTREPCPMCAMALLHSRVSRVVVAARAASGRGVVAGRGVVPVRGDGRRCRLQGLPGINHRYSVWVVEREDGGD